MVTGTFGLHIISLNSELFYVTCLKGVSYRRFVSSQLLKP